MLNTQQFRPDDFKLLQIIAETRELIRKAAQLLREPLPDTFLGRKTQEPFPKAKNS